MAVLAASVHKAPKLLIKLINKATRIRYYSLTHVQALTFSIQNVRIVKAKSRFRKLQLVCLCECENSDGDPPLCSPMQPELQPLRTPHSPVCAEPSSGVPAGVLLC